MLRQHFGFLRGTRAVVGRQFARIAQRRVEPGMAPVDQPHPAAVMQKVAGQLTVVLPAPPPDPEAAGSAADADWRHRPT